MVAATGRCFAEDWGAYALVPSSAPALVLVGAGEGATVTIGKPAGTANQKWYITQGEGDFYAIRPASSQGLVLAAAKGGSKNGTAVVLERDRGEAWQRWTIKKNENGTYSLLPKHAPEKGLDNNGGKKTPGAKQGLWSYSPKDGHLQWMIRPLAGSAVAAETAAITYTPPDLKPEEIPQGVTKNCSFSQSAIFPGTERDVTVFIPAQYDGTKPACVYVKTDGYNPREKAFWKRSWPPRKCP